MKNLYLVEAFEGKYQGLHGAVRYELVADCSYDILREIGTELSEGLVYQYNKNIDEDSWAELIMFVIYKVNIDIDLNFDDIDILMQKNPKLFIKKYCEYLDI